MGQAWRTGCLTYHTANSEIDYVSGLRRKKEKRDEVKNAGQDASKDTVQSGIS